MIGWVPGDVELGRADGIHLEISRRAARLFSFRRRFQNLDGKRRRLLNFYFSFPPPFDRTIRRIGILITLKTISTAWNSTREKIAIRGGVCRFEARVSISRINREADAWGGKETAGDVWLERLEIVLNLDILTSLA